MSPLQIYWPSKEQEQIGVPPAEGTVEFLGVALTLFCKVKKYFTATGGFQKIPAGNYAEKKKKALLKAHEK